MRGVVLTGFLLLAGLSGCLGGVNSTPRDVVRISLDVVIQGLDDPVFVTHSGDDSGRLFVAEQGGVVRVWDGGTTAQVYLDLSEKVSCCSERGLLGLAFDPDFNTNGHFFVAYTALGGDVTLAQYTAGFPSASVANPASERILLLIEHSTYGNHNGGMLAFGPDGYLYMSVGDGGSGGDPNNNAQNLDSLLGKILRIIPSPKMCFTTPCPQVDSPSGNPFVNKAGRDEIWAYGLRNPWRFSFDRATGDMWIGDVGQGEVEEVDLATAGRGGLNFGWSRFEGSQLYNGEREAPGATGPVAEYDRDSPHCAITGGYVYRGTAIPDLVGSYLFADYCSGTMWSLRRDGDDWLRRQALETSLFISSFGEDENGELLVVDHAGASGKVYRVVSG